MTLLDQGTQHNAALVEESSAAAQSLNQQAQRLMQAVSAFRSA
jgi:methyl-accepting chemotaxis protein